MTAYAAPVLLLASALLANPAMAQQRSDCSGEEYRAFEFWVGEWDVRPASAEAPIAASRIEAIGNGCAIRETWMPLQGGGGTSITTREPGTGVWHQLWVGQQPGRVFFEGGMVGEAMVLSGYWGRNSEGAPQLVRMTYTAREDGTVRQHGEASSDHGATWSDSFDLIYMPKGE